MGRFRHLTLWSGNGLWASESGAGCCSELSDFNFNASPGGGVDEVEQTGADLFVEVFLTAVVAYLAGTALTTRVVGRRGPPPERSGRQSIGPRRNRGRRRQGQNLFVGHAGIVPTGLGVHRSAPEVGSVPTIRQGWREDSGVLRHELLCPGGIGHVTGPGDMLGDLGEVLLVAARREDHDVAGRFVERVAEAVRQAATGEHRLPGYGRVELITDTEPQLSLKDHERLVMTVMDMGGRTHKAWRHTSFYGREASDGVAGGDLDQHRPVRQIDPVATVTATGEPLNGLALLVGVAGWFECHARDATARRKPAGPLTTGCGWCPMEDPRVSDGIFGQLLSTRATKALSSSRRVAATAPGSAPRHDGQGHDDDAR